MKISKQWPQFKLSGRVSSVAKSQTGQATHQDYTAQLNGLLSAAATAPASDPMELLDLINQMSTAEMWYLEQGMSAKAMNCQAIKNDLLAAMLEI